jgi:ubiquinone/menaquinone biosynthesis C-methylase UbiE
MNNKYTGERLITTVFNENTINHLHRYAIALDLVKGKTVLDIASGEGYGSNLLSSQASKVYGVDIDEEAVKDASIIYDRENLQFLHGTTSKIPLADNSVDIVISFETLEHHDEHDEMMVEIIRVLKPDGTLLISTPDKHFYSDLKDYNNPFHVKELYKNEFMALVSGYFKFYNLYSQSYINGSSIILENNNRDHFNFFTGDFNQLKETMSSPEYLLLICSNSNAQIIKNSIFEGKHILDNKLLDARIKYVYDSNTFKVGYFILRPFKFFKRILKDVIK